MKQKQPNSYDEKHQKARSLISKGLYGEAIEILTKLEAENPYKPAAFQTHSFVLLRGKKYPDAAHLADKGLTYCPKDASLKRNLAEALSHISGESSRAKQLFSELRRDFANDTKFLSTYADFLVRHDQFTEAREIYNTILSKSINKNKRERTIIDLARSYRFDYQPEKGLDVLNENPMPQNPYWLRENGNCLLDIGKYQQALALFSQARIIIADEAPRARQGFISRLEPLEKSAEALSGRWKEVLIWLMNQSVSLFERKVVWRSIRQVIKNLDFYDTMENLLGLLSKYPNEYSLGYEIKRFVLESEIAKDKDKLNELTKKILEIAPTNSSILEMAAQINLGNSTGDYWEKAWSTTNKAEKIDKISISKIAQGYSQHLRQEKSIDIALDVLEQARTLVGHNWDLELERAICLSRIDNYIEAINILKNLDEEKPDNPIVLDQLGKCLRSNGLLEEAVEIYRKKLSIQDDVQGRQGLGRTLYELGKYNEASRIFEELLAEYPQDAELKLHLANILLAKGEINKAQNLYNEIKPADLATRGLELIDAEKKIAVLNRNLTDKEAEIEQSRRLAYLGTMATATAHELNQPIGIIRALADSGISDIKANLISKAEFKPLLEKILLQTTRLANIIDNLRSFARNDRTKKEPVDINKLIDQVVQMFSEQFKNRNIQLELFIQNKNPYPQAWANPVQLEEVLINLLTNARDAVEGKSNALVRVTCWRYRDGGSGISVEDNGVGLSSEYKTQIFTPFVSTKPTEKGTGLGLFISRRLITELGGRLRFEDRPGGGVKFVVQLPPIKGEDKIS